MIRVEPKPKPVSNDVVRQPRALDSTSAWAKTTGKAKGQKSSAPPAPERTTRDDAGQDTSDRRRIYIQLALVVTTMSREVQATTRRWHPACAAKNDKQRAVLLSAIERERRELPGLAEIRHATRGG